MLSLPQNILDLIARGAIFYVSHSGGKDSQDMYAYIKARVPAAQIVVIHADLGAVEWKGTQGHIRANIDHPLNVVRARRTLQEMVRERGMFPSPQQRQCTSDLKRGPIETFIRRDMKARGSTLAVNCMGFRAEESTARSKRNVFEIHKKLSVAGREVYTWLPIFSHTLWDVWCAIFAAGQRPHYAYYGGNRRLSCVFCIMGCIGDLRHGAEQRPELLEEYQGLERDTGHTIFTYKGKPIPIAEYLALEDA